jgi:hypothetical protein
MLNETLLSKKTTICVGQIRFNFDICKKIVFEKNHLFTTRIGRPIFNGTSSA